MLPMLTPCERALTPALLSFICPRSRLGVKQQVFLVDLPRPGLARAHPPAPGALICPCYLKSFACLLNCRPSMFMISVCPPDRVRAGSGWTRWLTCCGWRLRAPSRPRPAPRPPLAPTASTSAWSACAAWVRPPAAQGPRGPKSVPHYNVWLYGLLFCFFGFSPPPPPVARPSSCCVYVHTGPPARPGVTRVDPSPHPHRAQLGAQHHADTRHVGGQARVGGRRWYCHSATFTWH